jgi:hypothetical protein
MVKEVVSRLDNKNILWTVLIILFFAYLLYPIIDITKFAGAKNSSAVTGVSSDSALILHMIAETTPWRENVFVWGNGRSGSMIFLISKIVYLLTSPDFTLRFVNFLVTLFIVLGMSVPILFRNKKPIFVPIGVLFFTAALRMLQTPNQEMLMLVTADLVHRPEFILILNGTILLSVYNFLNDKKHILPLLILTIMSAWLNYLTIPLLFVLFVVLTLMDIANLPRKDTTKMVLKNIKLWPWMVLIITFLATLILVDLSMYKPTNMFKLAAVDVIKTNFAKGILNLYQIFPTQLWILMLLLNIGFLVAHLKQMQHDKGYQNKFYFRYWLCLSALAVVSFVLPFGSEWFYGNLALPRYTVTALHLLIISTSVSIVGLVNIIAKDKGKRLMLLLALSIIIITICAPLLQYRSERVSAPQSPQFRSGQMLAKNCDGIIGSYWNSYVYGLGGFGKLKTGSYGFDRSRVNLERVLNLKDLCVVENQAHDFRSNYTILNKTLKPLNNTQNITQLPDGNYYKHYTTSVQ